jgi:hypothetical protein
MADMILPMRGMALTLLVALALAGCGSSTSAQDQFVARASGIYVKARRAEALAPTSKGEQLETTATWRAQTAHELAALKPPDTLKAGFLRLVSAIAQEASLRQRFVNDYRRHDDAGAIATGRKLRRSNPVPRLALQINLTACV